MKKKIKYVFIFVGLQRFFFLTWVSETGMSSSLVVFRVKILTVKDGVGSANGTVQYGVEGLGKEKKNKCTRTPGDRLVSAPYPALDLYIFLRSIAFS